MEKNNSDILFKSVSDFFGVLSNPDRIKILGLLKDKELDVKEIHEKLNISQSRASQHLKLLKLHSLIKERREGKHVFYSVKDTRILKLVETALQIQLVGMTANTNLITTIHELIHFWHF